MRRRMTTSTGLQAYEQGTLTASGNNGSSVLDTVNTNTASGAWTLDALGNWTSVTTNGTPASRSFNAQNQITGSTITYDGDGNMTQDDRGITYTYDGWNHLLSETSGSTVGKYAYDGLGRRISDTQITASGSAITFSFFTQAWQVAEDYTATVNASGSVTWGAKYRYIYGPGGINDLVARDDFSGNRLYVQMDANDDVTALVGKVGSAWQVVERFVYTPYGKLSATLNASWGTGGITDYHWVYLWQMGRYDSLSGLTNFRNRDYSPTLGTWIEKDPTGANYIDGGNLYQAMDGNPAGYSDPFGLSAISTAWTWFNIAKDVYYGVTVGFNGSAAISSAGLPVAAAGMKNVGDQQAYQQLEQQLRQENRNGLLTDDQCEQLWVEAHQPGSLCQWGNGPVRSWSQALTSHYQQAKSQTAAKKATANSANTQSSPSTHPSRKAHPK